jgi:hypothetical protein
VLFLLQRLLRNSEGRLRLFLLCEHRLLPSPSVLRLLSLNAPSPFAKLISSFGRRPFRRREKRRDGAGIFSPKEPHRVRPQASLH